jgi:DNA (cytosine-5)-methyltransferase 1
LIPTLPPSQFAAWQLARLPEEMNGTCLVEGNSPTTRPPLVAGADEPSWTVRAASYKGFARAFLAHANDQRSMPVRGADDPAFTIAAASHDSHAPDTKPKAWLVEGQTGSSGEYLNVLESEQPSYTVAASADHRPARAWLAHGRVVKMTPRALARFQSLPDSYLLPDKAGLACTVIGNMVPSLLMQQIVEPLL